MAQKIYIIFIAFIFCGCAPATKKNQNLVVGNKSIAQMASNDEIVRVNGKALTRGEYDELVDLKERLFKIQHPNLGSGAVSRLKKHFVESVLSEFVIRQLLVQDAHRKKHIPTTDAAKAIRRDTCIALKVDEARLDEKLMELGPARLVLEKVIHENMVIFSLRHALYKDKLEVTEADVAARISQIQAVYERAEATNQLVMAKGRDLYKQLKEGADFFDMAEKFSEAKDSPAGVWGEFVKGQIENAQVLDAATHLPVGSVAEPLETDEGLFIIKVLYRSDDFNKPSLTVGAKVRLGRIVLRMFEGGANSPLPSNEDIRKVLADEKIIAIQNEWLASLHSKAVIEYPNGTNFWAVGKTGQQADVKANVKKEKLRQ